MESIWEANVTWDAGAGVSSEIPRPPVTKARTVEDISVIGERVVGNTVKVANEVGDYDERAVVTVKQTSDPQDRHNLPA